MGKLFWKFFMVFWLALLTAGVGAGTVVWLRHEAAAQDQPSLPNVRFAEPIIAAASATLAHGGVTALRGFLNDWSHGRNPPVYAVDENGADLLGRPVSPEVLAQAKQAAGGRGRPRGVRQMAADDGHTYLLFSAPPRQPLIGKPPGRDGKSLHRKPPSPTVSILAGIAASLIFSALLAWYFAKPIRNLRSAFDAAAQGNLDSRVGSSMGNRRDELADLGRHFDRMAVRIKSLMEAQQRLLHDVSHELRSPLARMQAAIGLAHQQPDKIAPALERIEQESQRMDDLVGELLTLSRLETGVPGKMEDDIDLGELLADIIGDVRFEANGKSVAIEYSGVEDVIVKGQSELIHRAIENVLRNAIQHSEPGGTVCVDTQCDASERRFVLAVADRGPGVAETELAAIFEPFFRSSGPRKEKSTGLGLSIARRAIEAHGGKIGAANRPAGGLRIEISIPFERL
jgi:two-component system OmpR family sensor kinase